MDARELVNAQFDRAVEIVQGLPKNGPIQTEYEEKLNMYSLYKQATVGNVTTARPGIFDMLGRAKWDEWAKRKDLDQYQAKWLYVEALKKVLRKYSEKTVARNLLDELDTYDRESANLVLSHHFSTSRGSASSGSTASERPDPSEKPIQQPEPHMNVTSSKGSEGDETSEDDAAALDDTHGASSANRHPPSRPQPQPQSSISSHRYRTPMASMLATSPQPAAPSTILPQVPAQQPLPLYETPSAFAPAKRISHAGQFSEFRGADDEAHRYPAQPYPSLPQPHSLPLHPASHGTLERAVEQVQAHLAAVHERLESLESFTAASRVPPRAPSSAASSAARNRMTGPLSSPYSFPASGRYWRRRRAWTMDDLGLWSLVANPVARVVRVVHRATSAVLFFFFHFLVVPDDEEDGIDRSTVRLYSPTLIVLRRLCLDASFLLCVLALMRALWRRSGVRRREVRAALIVLGRAVLGTKKERVMVDQGV